MIDQPEATGGRADALKASGLKLRQQADGKFAGMLHRRVKGDGVTKRAYRAPLGGVTANLCTNSGQNPIDSSNAQMGIYP
jgi:hypothetical protein